MAYNNKDEKVTVLLDIEKNGRGDYVRLSRIEKNGEINYDLRNMYMQENGELGFTNKGIRVKDDMMQALVEAYLKDSNGTD